jgi:hypothetical protein
VEGLALNRSLRQILLLVISLSPALLLYPARGFPFATQSHRTINELAASGSEIFNPHLKDALGITAGLDAKMKNSRGVERSIVGWIGEGGAAEDRLFFGGWLGEKLGGVTRSLNHFHQPLRDPWDQAGLITANPSSARWAQNPAQAPGRMASWFDARNSFLAALNATTEQQRNALFAETFQTLGQVMHLVADLGSVSHTRDDAHPLAYEFEKFVEKNPGVISGFIGFDPSILQQPTGDSYAILPIARLWDTNTYNGTNPPGELDWQIGLAEFTNANFFSRDTIRTTAGADPELPLPAISQLDLVGVTAPDPRTGKTALYYSKNRDGVQVPHMVRLSLFTGLSSCCSGPYILDDLVYQDYASYLLPRAIGYSAGILDYFFRGKIKIEAPSRYVYALAKYEQGTPGFFTRMELKVKNDTEYPSDTEDTVGPGEMRAVVRYRKPLSGNLIANPFGQLSEPFYAVSAAQSVDLTRSAKEVSFDFTGSPIPTNAADIFLMVVWKGKLGMEDGAIMVGGKNLFEPDPFDRGNVSDYDCYQNQIYTVTQPSISTADRDVNDDDLRDLAGPVTETKVYVQIYDPESGPVPDINSVKINYHFLLNETKYIQSPSVSGPPFGRFMMLQDKPVFGVYILTEKIRDDFDGSVSSDDQSVYAFAAVQNEFGPGGLRIVSPSLFYRGVPIFHAVVRLASFTMFNNAICKSQLSAATPNMINIPGIMQEE